MELWSDQVAFVFDVSGSMEYGAIQLDGDDKKEEPGTPFSVMKSQLVKLLRGLPPKARFNLIAYSDKPIPFKKSLVVRSRGSLKAASKFLDKLSAGGETNIYDALLAALSDPEVDTIFLLTDGEPSRGARIAAFDILEGIAENNRFRRVVINVIQIGRDQELMHRLADANGGQLRHLPLAKPKVHK